MKNEFNVTLDRNGYAPSIVQKGRESLLGEVSGPDRCYVCSRREGYGFLERLGRHEPWNAANRTKSKNLGLRVTICRGCHEEAHGQRPGREPRVSGSRPERRKEGADMKFSPTAETEWSEFLLTLRAGTTRRPPAGSDTGLSGKVPGASA